MKRCKFDKASECHLVGECNLSNLTHESCSCRLSMLDKCDTIKDVCKLFEFPTVLCKELIKDEKRARQNQMSAVNLYELIKKHSTHNSAVKVLKWYGFEDFKTTESAKTEKKWFKPYLEWCEIMNQEPNEKYEIVFCTGYNFAMLEKKYGGK